MSVDFSEIYDKLHEQAEIFNENVQGLQSQAQEQQFVINNLQENL